MDDSVDAIEEAMLSSWRSRVTTNGLELKNDDGDSGRNLIRHTALVPDSSPFETATPIVTRVYGRHDFIEDARCHTLPRDAKIREIG